MVIGNDQVNFELIFSLFKSKISNEMLNEVIVTSKYLENKNGHCTLNDLYREVSYSKAKIESLFFYLRKYNYLKFIDINQIEICDEKFKLNFKELLTFITYYSEFYAFFKDFLIKPFEKSPEFELIATIPDKILTKTFKKFGIKPSKIIFSELLHSSKKEVVILNPFLEKNVLNELFFDFKTLVRNNVNLIFITRLDKSRRLFVKNEQFIYELFEMFKKEGKSNNLKVYSDKKDNRIHAKLIIVDESIGYIGSTNFTTKGINEAIEFGVIIKSKEVKQIKDFIIMLINNQIFEDYKI